MWFFTEFLERYTRNIARSFMRMTAMEADASRRVFTSVGVTRDRKNGLILPELSLNVPPTLVTERRALLDTEGAPAGLAEAVEAVRADEALRRADEGDVARTLVSLEAMPMGVRGDVVLKYVEALSGASGGEAGALIGRLSRDKKVRIAELQLIAADVLGEAVTRRTKVEHYEALRRALGAGSGASVPAVPHAAAHAELRAH